MKERQLQVVQLACFYFCIQKSYLYRENLSYSPICLCVFWKDPQEITKRQLPEGPGDVFYLHCDFILNGEHVLICLVKLLLKNNK